MIVLGIPVGVILSQLMLGLMNGAFYALLSLGLAVIFGLLRIINFAHGAFYTIGAFAAAVGLNGLGIGYWPALILVPVIVGLVGVVIERLLLRPIAHLDHLYGLLLTFGLALIVEGLLHHFFGSSGLPYPVPSLLAGGINTGFMFLPIYRLWVIGASVVTCFGVWFLVERTQLGSYLRAATENPVVVQAFGINVPLLVTATYGFGVALAAFAGVMAAPIYQASTQLGSNIIIVFAVVVIGGLGSTLGAVIAGLALGLVEGLTKVLYPEASGVIIFVIMAFVLLAKPAGLMGKEVSIQAPQNDPGQQDRRAAPQGRTELLITIVLITIALIAPAFISPSFLTRAFCLALFACAFNLILGFGGLLSFGHACFFGAASYLTAHAAKVWGLDPITAIFLGTLASSFLGLIIGSLAIRRQGVYFAMITLALAQMIYFVALRAPFTHGEDGISGIPRGALFGLINLDSQISTYYFIFAIFLFGYFAIARIVRSPYGQVLRSIKDNEPRAISLGFNASAYKLSAFVLSATFAGLAGSAKAIAFQLATLADVHWSLSGEVVLMALIGGVGTLFGPVVGAFCLVMLQNYLAESGKWVTLIQGCVFVACVLTFRSGIVGLLKARFQRQGVIGPLKSMAPKIAEPYK